MFDGNIYVSTEFQTAINVAYDLNSEEKVESFVPTSASLHIINEIMHSTASSSSRRARILIGAYGRGKSHIILQLVSILSKRNLAGIDKFLEKISPINGELHDYISNYLSSNKKLLPVIINGNSTSLTQSFLNAIQATLLSAGLSKFMPTTGFSLVYDNVQKWKTDFPSTYREFENFLDYPIDEFEMKIKKHDLLAYEKFLDIYPKVTSGSEFNPFVNGNVPDILDEIIDSIRPLGYNGVFIIYDEFSKYLESNIGSTTTSDTKLLQDLAEKCNRSGEQQMHLLLVSHKDISNYTDVELPKKKIAGWRGVSARFEHMYISNSFSQVYKVISAVIEKKEPFWTNYLLENSNLFNALEKVFSERKMFVGVQSLKDEVIQGCFPLHPISTFILPRLSEKIAQNERTLFTFLASTSKNTLNDFLNTSSSLLLTPDWIYDYFEPLLRQEPVNSNAISAFMLSQRIINQLEDELEIQIIKTIALIDIVEQFELLPPTPEIIINAFAQIYPDLSAVQGTLENLIAQKFLVYLNKSNGFLKLKESSGVNIYQRISDEKERVRSTQQIEKMLNTISNDKYFYPMRYNIENAITRYFEFKFVSASVFLEVTNWDYYLEQTLAEGIIVAIYASSAQEIELVRVALMKQTLSKQILFILPKKHKDIEEEAFEYIATEKLLQESVEQEDNVLATEYDLVLRDLTRVLDTFISIYTTPNHPTAEYFYLGTLQKISRRSQLSELLSAICEELFPNTPIINNESINKNYLSTVAFNSRTRILNGILEPVLVENLGLSGGGQDVSIMRSTLLRTNILETVEENGAVALVEATLQEDNNITKVLGYINEFIEKAQVSISFQELYLFLTLPKHGIGLKLGVIPIYLAICLRPYLDFVVITKSEKEVRVNADLLNSININPSYYSIKIINWDNKRELYFSALEKTFEDYTSQTDRRLNRFTYVYEAMKRWYMSLPQFSQQFREVYLGVREGSHFESLPLSSQKFLDSFSKMERNPQEFLVEEVPEFYCFDEVSDELAAVVQATKNSADKATINLLNSLASDIKSMFSTSENIEASLYSVIKDWIGTLSKDTLQHIFPENETQILNSLREIKHHEHQWISELAPIITSLRIGDWKRDTILQFTQSLYSFKECVEKYESDDTSKRQSEGYKLVVIQKDGAEEVRSFDRISYNGRATLLYNEVNTAVRDMGQSISPQEKRQVLMDILEKLL